jgi:hypothetical protein
MPVGVEALARAGRLDEARLAFEKAHLPSEQSFSIDACGVYVGSRVGDRARNKSLID